MYDIDEIVNRVNKKDFSKKEEEEKQENSSVSFEDIIECRWLWCPNDMESANV